MDLNFRESLSYPVLHISDLKPEKESTCMKEKLNN